ncbi:MAG: hypothetical protein HYY14_04590 [Candidatus Omnitrophica bacterium]|nr:hypothetical protein [Candidatus Omnitrophota bacterium]
MRLRENLRRLGNFLRSLLDRISAFCLAAVMLMALQALLAPGSDDQDPFPSLEAKDLPILAHGIEEKDIVLDFSLCDVSGPEAGEFNPGLIQIERSRKPHSHRDAWL